MIENAPVRFPNPKSKKIRMSEPCKDFIKRLLSKTPEGRLGSKQDFKELLAHPWLKEVDVEDYLNKRIEPPFKPSLRKNPMDTSHFSGFFTKQSVEHVLSEEENYPNLPEEDQKKFEETFGKF